LQLKKGEGIGAYLKCLSADYADAGRLKEKLACRNPRGQNPRMRLEHCALQVPDPVAMADWYVKNAGCKIARSEGAPGFGQFLAAGPVLIEIYKNNICPTPNYGAVHPQQLHLAFVSENLKADRDRLVAAGAKLVDDLFLNAVGDQLVMLRDPWGVPLQLVKRTTPMLGKRIDG